MPVDCWDAPAGWAVAWSHQLRWSRTIRICQPAPYFASILSNLTLWAAALAVVVLASDEPAPGSPARLALLGLSAGALGWRILMGNLLYGRLCEGFPPLATAWMPWMKDLLGFAVWVASFAGNTVEWRGMKFRVCRNGELTPVN